MENASREYNATAIKKMVEQQKEKYGWEIIFLGANIDALSAAERVTFQTLKDERLSYW